MTGAISIAVGVASVASIAGLWNFAGWAIVGWRTRGRSAGGCSSGRRSTCAGLSARSSRAFV